MKSLSTSLRILSAFAGNQPSWTVTGLAESLDLSPSQVSKNLSTFKRAGLLEQDPKTKAYRAGIGAFALGAQYLNNNPLVHESAGVVRRLADLTRQTCSVCVLCDGRVLHLVSVEGPQFVDVVWRVGTWMPFHATAVGKVLYAHEPEPMLEQALQHGLQRYTPNTICDPQEFRAQLALVREQGYSTTREESMRGLGAQAVPIYGVGQHVIAALGIVYPLHAVEEQAMRRHISDLHAGARTISQRMGCPVYPYGEGHDA